MSSDVQEILKAGIDAARRGNKIAARGLLEQVIERDPNNEMAWLWLASAVDTLEERRNCLQNVLRINPNNPRAREALARLTGETKTAEQGRRVVEQLRQRRKEEENPYYYEKPATRSISTPYLIIGAAAAVVILIGLIFSGVLVSESGGLASQPPTEVDAEILFNATETNTPDPSTFTDTPIPAYVEIVDAPTNAPTLPPTFTPTFTPTPPDTPLPSLTPFPLSEFLVVYTALDAGAAQGALFRMNADGSAEDNLGPASEGFTDVAFSPEGDKIAFVRVVTYSQGEGENAQEITSPELFVASLDNIDDAQQVTQLGRDLLADPSWAPNNVQLAFTSNFDGDEEIWTVTEDGNNLLQLTNNTEVIDREPAWSPDGNTILFTSDLDSPGLTEIYRMNADGSEIARLTNDNGSSYSPAWSPDGQRVAFATDRGGDSDIYIMEPNGEGSLLLTIDDGDAEDRSPRWSPDNRWVGFISNRSGDNFQPYMVDLRGDVLVRLIENDQDFASFDFQSNPLFRLR
jgi:Tol biopolymer transport system component